MRLPLIVLCLAVLSVASLSAQVCATGQTQIQNDSLPSNPAGNQNITVISGFCTGDRAGSIFDLSAFSGPVPVFRAGILFAGPPGSQPATGRLHIYNTVAIAPSGAATLPAPIFTSSSITFQPNALTSLDISMSNVVITTGTMVVAFEMTTNPNEPLPGLGCLLGYSASFASDNTAPTGSCNTPPGINLIFDPAQGWWDITGFQIGGTPWCGTAFNGNWVIRACVGGAPSATYPGTGEDFVVLSSAGANPLDSNDVELLTAGNQYNLQVASPNGTFNGAPLLVLADVFPTGGPAPTPLLPGLQVGASFGVVSGGVAGPLGSLTLPPVGHALSFQVPNGLSGTSVLFQGAVVTFAASNMAYATTDGHVAQIQ